MPVGLLRRLGFTATPDLTPSTRRPDRTFQLELPPEMTGLPALGGIAPRISRREALQVPAVLRGRNLIAGSLATLPIRVHGPDRRVVGGDGTYVVPQPDPDIPQSVTIASTVEDLVFEGVAWWHIMHFGWHGYPTAVEYCPVDTVSVQPDGSVWIDGRRVPDREIIRFDSPNPPVLVHAARAIRTCLLLDQAAALYSKEPLPLGYFTPKEGADQMSSAPGSAGDGTDRSEIEAMLDAWEDARQARAWGYVGAMDAKALQWDPKQLQLVEQRQHAVVEIGRALGIDPEDLGVSTTSRTYQNGEQRRQDMLDFTLGSYVSALQDRLSMRDVLPRGYAARIDFGGFLRSDTKTRMETYKVGLEVDAYTDDEIRELENRPKLTPAEKRASEARRSAARPQPASHRPTLEVPQPSQNGARMNGHAKRNGATFADDSTTAITFSSADVDAQFRVDPERRTISGLLMPWNHVGFSRGHGYRFAPGSITWTDVKRVKLFRDHDYTQAFGVATSLENTADGLVAKFKIARGAEGDRALALAEDGVLDGLSAGVDFSGHDDYVEDSEGVRNVARSILREGSVTALPAFDGARVSSVAATRNGRTDQMDKCLSCGLEHAAGTPCATPTPTPQGDGSQFAQLTDAITKLGTAADAQAQFNTQLLERFNAPQRDPNDPAPAAGRPQAQVREAPVYTFMGHGPSLVRDSWNARVEGSTDARERLLKFGRQQQDMVQLANQHPELAAQFDVKRADVPNIIPPGYRPDLYITQMLQGRPLVDSVSKGQLSDATPFVLPSFGSATNAASDHVEGTNPTTGAVTINAVTVTPGATSGLFQLTREIVDSANPAIDAIAMQAMREAYSQQTEAKMYAQLNGATGQGGTVTAGFVPSGAQVSNTASGAATEDASFGGAALLRGVRNALALYAFRRFAAPNRMHLSQEGTSAFAAAVGSDGRPLLPSVGATNTVGVGNAQTQGWFVDGLVAQPTWSMSGNAAGDADVLIFNSQDVWAWESPLLTFRFEERNGPALIELALFGYFACRLIRPVGLAAIRHDATFA